MHCIDIVITQRRQRCQPTFLLFSRSASTLAIQTNPVPNTIRILFFRPSLDSKGWSIPTSDSLEPKEKGAATRLDRPLQTASRRTAALRQGVLIPQHRPRL